MKFPLAWLKEHLETEATLDQIVEKLTAEMDLTDEPSPR